jgi:hypothetical protein
VAIAVSSVATGIAVSFSSDSGATFFPLMRDDGSGTRFLVSSGGQAGQVVVSRPPSPWLRLEAAASTFAAATSAFIVDVI